MAPRILQGPETSLLFNDMSLGQFFFEMSLKHGDNIAQIDSATDRKESFNNIRKRSVRAAIEMAKRGITSNDVVVFCTVNCLDNAIPFIGAAYLGAKVASLDPTLSLSHVGHLLSIVGPSMVFVEEKSVSLIEAAIETLKIFPQIVVFGESSQYSTIGDFTKPAENEDEFKPLAIDPGDAAILLFSSGTTGLPKAICLSSKNILPNSTYLLKSINYSSITHFTTLYWISGVYMLLRSFAKGSCRILVPKFDVEATLRIIEKYKITYFTAAPILLYKLVCFHDIKNFDISSLDAISVGGTPISEAQLIKIHEVLKNVNIIIAYGMTENGMISLTEPVNYREIARANLKSCGRVAPGVTVKIVDINSREILPPNQKGEICVKSSRLMIGYYKADSSQVFDGDGFLKTGDVGYYDDNENLYVVNRIKEMFKYQSWHIVPSVIENVLLQHPAVVEACVFGVPHEVDGDVPAAAVVLKDDKSAAPEEIAEFVARRVLDRERLRAGVRIVEKLPKTPTGKLIRPEIRQLAIKSMEF